MAGVGLTLLGIATAAALLEWAGWGIAWRHAGGAPVLDAGWRSAFIAGTARTMAGAAAIGALAAGATLGLGKRRSWPAWNARRRSTWSFVAGAGGFLAILALLTLRAP